MPSSSEKTVKQYSSFEMGIAPSIKFCFLAAFLHTITSHPNWPVNMILHLYSLKHLAQEKMPGLMSRDGELLAFTLQDHVHII